ncbi:MAG: phosphoglycerate kinase [Anaerolineaceae bacterium]|nr:phosphoglycerate kinase [Anaerolineaceae bacterium]
MNKQSVRDVSLTGKRVLMRVDFNVPLRDGVVSNDARIRAALPTLQYLLERGPKALVLLSHLGRPKGRVDPRWSLQPVAGRLQELLGRKLQLHFVADCGGPLTQSALAALPEGGILLLENTRFDPGETSNDPAVARSLASMADIFVNDAFGAAHRAHASTVGVAQLLPSVAGLLMERELDYLATALEAPRRPFVAILGGAKVSDKISVIEALLQKVDRLLIGGGMANTFFRAQGLDLGASLVEEDAVSVAENLLKEHARRIVLPTDAILGNSCSQDADVRCIMLKEAVPPGWAIYDIGPVTLQRFAAELRDARTIVWNGPMGVFELAPFANGSNEVAALLAAATATGATTIIGGGDSAAAVEAAGLAGSVTHISTGGGASLEMLEGRVLPGVEALDNRQSDD